MATKSKYFDYSLDFKNINFREHPEMYQVGRGEQGVLLVEPYKSEILPYWRFKSPGIAKKSADKIYKLFINYKKNKDFVGMDMARKFLQMGYTRARRYANHASGKKYVTNPQKKNSIKEEKLARKNVLPQESDWKTSEKAIAARIFYDKYLQVKNDEIYIKLRKKHENLQMKF